MSSSLELTLSLKPSSSSDAIVEEKKEEIIISPGDEVSVRKAIFLRPCAINPVFAVQPLLPDTSKSSLPVTSVNFKGWESPMDGWKQWVRIVGMWHHHHPTWMQAGVHDAIKNSTYKIPRNEELIFRLAERWCPETNTFVFPWGEATITLEDMMIMGGFPVTGCSSSSVPLDMQEMKETKELLEKMRLELVRTSSKKPVQSKWMDMFMCSGSKIEHEAFLAYWLSRFVFPAHATGNIIREEVFPIAVCLARGVKVALAPAILASIYKDLTSLKVRLVAARYSPDSVKGKELRLSSPLQVVQVWAWERFPALQANPRPIFPLEPRMAQWDGSVVARYVDYSVELDSPRKGFLWRPYVIEGNCLSQNFYKQREKYWQAADGVWDDNVEALVRCMRVTELAGLKGDFTEMYNPHRVAMQFGLDQDLPGDVEPASGNPNSTWRRYTRPIGDAALVYVPAKDFKAGVTERYKRWWKGLKFARKVKLKGHGGRS